MKIAILGAGFTGLSTAFYLKENNEITIFEKENIPGGLAISFQNSKWSWPLEKHYHHFFTNDKEIIKLARKIGYIEKIIYPKSQTSLWYQNRFFNLNSISQILSFSPLSLTNRLRLGIATVFLKILPEKTGYFFEKFTAISLAKFFYGESVYQTIWKPLLQGKFGNNTDEVNGAWLWARIKKRSLKLGYFENGYQGFARQIEKKLLDKKVNINYQTEIKKIEKKQNGKWLIETSSGKFDFDIVISTLPSRLFVKIFPDISKNLKDKIDQLKHLSALNLVLELKKPFLKNIYWLNINEDNYPFLCLVQHTNFIDKKNYDNHHLLYIGNYLAKDHEYLKLSKEDLLQEFLPYLKKINPQFSKNDIVNSYLFPAPFAQPIFTVNYSKLRIFGETPHQNLFIFNLDSVYPWDRGANYAIEGGRKIAELINSRNN